MQYCHKNEGRRHESLELQRKDFLPDNAIGSAPDRPNWWFVSIGNFKISSRHCVIDILASIGRNSDNSQICGFAAILHVVTTLLR